MMSLTTQEVAQLEQNAFKAGWKMAKTSLFTDEDVNHLASVRYPITKPSSHITINGVRYRWNAQLDRWQYSYTDDFVRPRNADRSSWVDYSVWITLEIGELSKLPTDVLHLLIDLKDKA